MSQNVTLVGLGELAPRSLFSRLPPCAVPLNAIARILADIKIAAVARQLGVSRSWASREANAPGTRNLIAELPELRRERTYEVDGGLAQV
jgi:hypothetical protein